jgi:hypothetical protein
VLDDVALVLGDAPAGGDGDDVALAEGVGGVVDEVVLGVVEELSKKGGVVSIIGAWLEEDGEGGDGREERGER